ncbi:M48 family metalloprotease [Burkholderiaceae bacterium DAT-1]|nr:M48 family metalloprotease [Burkholderiaceae bacterium DAT-1]
MKTKSTRMLMLALLVSAVLAGDLPDLGDSAAADVSGNDERKIAEQVTLELRLSGDVVDDPEIAGYMQRFGYALVSASADNRQPFRFFVLNDAQINAFAIPGGVVCVNSGLIVLTQHESELAAVLAHEVSHVTQHHYARMLESQKGTQYLALAGLVAGIMAARNNGAVAEAAIATSQSAVMQSYLSFSRDFEREADRIGMQVLEKSGFDGRAMPTFFDRMQRFYAAVDNGAMAFLRTHPVNSERISDSLQRAEQFPYKQVPDSEDYRYVREKVRTLYLGRSDALTFYTSTTAQKKYADEAAQHYGFAYALSRANRLEEAWRELELARNAAPRRHPMLMTLAGQIRLQQHQWDEARALYKDAHERFPSSLAASYGLVDVDIQQGKLQDAEDRLRHLIDQKLDEPDLYKRLADIYSRMKDTFRMHKAQADFYAARKQWVPAIEQLQIARRLGSDFYQMSAVDAQIADWRKLVERDRHLRPEDDPTRDDDKNGKKRRGGDGN